MSKTVGDFLIERLSEWGVSRIFGFPGRLCEQDKKIILVTSNSKMAYFIFLDLELVGLLLFISLNELQ